jgi:TolB-like protein
MTEPPQSGLYEFAGFRLDPRQHLLWKSDSAQAVPLTSRAFDTLLYLVEHRGQLLEKSALLKAIWPDVVVEENSLNQSISALRRVLGEQPGEHRFIVTVPGRGFRFVADVTVRERSSEAASVAAPSVAVPSVAVPSAPAPSIAVLAFANLTGDIGKEYFADGLAEALLHRLTRIPGLRVPARMSSFAYKGRNTDVRQIARDLDVQLVLEGSVRSAADRIRLAVQLVDGQTGYHVWSDTFDRRFEDLFDLEDELATAIVARLRVTFTGAPEQAVVDWRPTHDLTAYDLYLQARSLFYRPTEQNLGQAIVLYGRAIERDSRFALAFAGRAQARIISVVVDHPVSPASFDEADRDAQCALAIEPTLAEAMGVLGTVAAARGRLVEAERHFERARSFHTGSDPNVAEVAFAGNVLGTAGHLQAALLAIRRAQRLAPAAPAVPMNLAVVHLLLGHDAEAREFAQLALGAGWPSTLPPVPDVLSQLAVRQQRYDEARDLVTAAFSQPVRLVGTARAAELVFAALANPGSKDSGSKHDVLAQVRAVRAQLSLVGPQQLVRKRLLLWLVMLGELDDAFALATESFDHFGHMGFVGMAWGMLWMEEMRPFREDPRFQAVATRLGLADYWREFGPPDGYRVRDGRLIPA